MNTAPRAAIRGPFVAATALLLVAPAMAQLRVANWNVSQYTGGRVADIQTAVYGVFEGRSFAPDIIIAEEFQSAAATSTFVSALNTATGSPADWVGVYVTGPGGGEGNAFLYRTSKCVYRGSAIISIGGSSPNPPRNTVRFSIWPQGYAGNTVVLHCYNSHMKAQESGSDDEARRLLEAQRIRDDAQSLNASHYFLLGGDLNMHTSSESAYQELVGFQANNQGRFYDPIASPGSWYDNSVYRFVHTQDPVAGNGGMDDRYDLLLVSSNLINGSGLDYIGNATMAYSTTTWNDLNHSYRSWGNDGTSFNLGLRTTGNTMVGATIAQALINVATTSGGHLPVFLDLSVPPKLGSDASVDFGQVPQGQPAQAMLAVWNAGDTALWTAAGISDLHYTLAASAGFAAPGGPFVGLAGDAASLHLLTMDTSTPGPKSGTLTIASDAPEEPTRVIVLSGEVVAPLVCRGDCNCDHAVGFLDIDLFVAAVPNNQANWSAKYQQLYGSLPPAGCWDNCDVNGNGNVGFDDIDPFVAKIPSPCPN